jgi:protein TonB
MASVLYFTTGHAIQLPKSEEKVTISLTEFAPTSGDINQIEKSLPQNNPSKLIAKPQMHNNILKATPLTTPQKISSKSPVVSLEGSTLLETPHVAPLVSQSPLIDSPHLNVSSEIKNELQRSPRSSNEIGGATLGQIRAMIENAITYPAIARKLRLEGVAMIFFVLKPNGTVQTVRVQSTSGSETLDKKAVQTILSLSGQYPALGKTFELSIPIAFSLKKS